MLHSCTPGLPPWADPTSPGHLYTSTDNGATWRRRKGGYCAGLLMSADGNRLMVFSTNDETHDLDTITWWTSADGGATFTEEPRCPASKEPE